MRSPNENNRMRQGQQNNRRGRHNNNRRNNNNNSGKPQNMLTKSFDSNGPDVKIRGNAASIAEKYTALAHDAISSGSRIKAENYFQHAEHYKRIVSAALVQQAEQKAAHEARQAEQQAATEARRAEQQAKRASRQNEQAEQNTQPDFTKPSESSDQPELAVNTNAPSMNSGNNTPVDILSNNDTPIAAEQLSQTNTAQQKSVNPAKRTRRPKRKPIAKAEEHVIAEDVNNIEAPESAIAKSQIETAEKPARKPRKPRVAKEKPAPDAEQPSADVATENTA